MVDYRSIEHCARMIIESGSETEHRVGVTVSDPNHPMVSKRKETYLKHVRVKAKNELHAKEKAKNHFRKKGYKVHDMEMATMKEDINNTDKFVGDKKPESPNPVPRITPDATKGAKDASLTRQNSKQEKSQTMGNNVEEGALDAADTAAEYLVPYYSAGKKLYKGDKAGAAQDAAIDTALLATTGGVGKVLGGAARAGTKLLGGAVRSGEKAGIKAGEKAAITGAEKAGASALEKDAAKVAATDAEKTVAKTAAVDAEKTAGRVAATDAAKGLGKALTIGSAAMSGRKALPQHISASQHGNIVGHQPNINVHRAMKHRRMAEETGTDARETIEAMPRSDIKDRKDVQYVGRPDSAPSPMDKRSVLIRQEIQKKVIDESKRNADIIKQVKKEKGNTQQKETTMGDRKTRVFGDVIINPQLNDPNPGSGTVTS